MAKKTTTKKSTRSNQPKRKKIAVKKISMKTVSAQPDDPSYRVYRFNADLRCRLKERRLKLGSQRESIRLAIGEWLPKLIQGLTELEISVTDDKSSLGAVRLPLDASTLKNLRSASNWTNLPQTILVEAALRLATRDEPVKPKRSAKKS